MNSMNRFVRSIGQAALCGQTLDIMIPTAEDALTAQKEADHLLERLISLLPDAAFGSGLARQCALISASVYLDGGRVFTSPQQVFEELSLGDIKFLGELCEVREGREV